MLVTVNSAVTLSPGVIFVTTSLPSFIAAVPPFLKVSSVAAFSISATLPSALRVVGEYKVSPVTSAVTLTVPLVTAILTLDSLVKIANVAPAIRLTQSAMPISAPTKILLLKSFFIFLYYSFFVLNLIDFFLDSLFGIFDELYR